MRTGWNQIEFREDVVRRANGGDSRVFHCIDRGNRGYGEGNDGDRGEGSDAGEELGELGFLVLVIRNDNNNRANNKNKGDRKQPFPLTTVLRS